jgi:hypothetical protein
MQSQAEMSDLQALICLKFLSHSSSTSASSLQRTQKPVLSNVEAESNREETIRKTQVEDLYNWPAFFKTTFLCGWEGIVV